MKIRQLSNRNVRLWWMFALSELKLRLLSRPQAVLDSVLENASTTLEV